MKDVYMLGIGHNTVVLMELVESCGYTIKGLYHYNDDRTGEEEHGYPVIGSFDDLFGQDDLSGKAFCVTMGDPKTRSRISDRIRERGGVIPNFIHPGVIISRFAKIADGVTIGPFSIIQADTEIGRDNMILSGVNISHNCVIGSGCLISGGAIIGAHTTVGDRVFVGMGSRIISGKAENIGSDALIGAGAVVTKSVLADTAVWGVPAKPMKTTSRGQ